MTSTHSHLFFSFSFTLFLSLVTILFITVYIHHYIYSSLYSFIQRRYVINSPNQSVRTDEETGIVTSTGPVDLINMITQYVNHASNVEGYAELRAQVLVMVSQAVLSYLHEIELRVAQVRHLLRSDHPGESLLFLCVVVNDCETMMKAMENLEDEHLDFLEDALTCDDDDNISNNNNNNNDDNDNNANNNSTQHDATDTIYTQVRDGVHICIYIYREREKERKLKRE